MTDLQNQAVQLMKAKGEFDIDTAHAYGITKRTLNALVRRGHFVYDSRHSIWMFNEKLEHERQQAQQPAVLTELHNLETAVKQTAQAQATAKTEWEALIAELPAIQTALDNLKASNVAHRNTQAAFRVQGALVHETLGPDALPDSLLAITENVVTADILMLVLWLSDNEPDLLELDREGLSIRITSLKRARDMLRALPPSTKDTLDVNEYTRPAVKINQKHLAERLEDSDGQPHAD